jgi:Zn-dependent protease/predicted transcriptional regulator
MFKIQLTSTENVEERRNTAMKWSWKVGRFAGIDVYVHATFWLLIGWIAVSHILQGDPALQTLAAIAFILALFACVVLHEFGHALTARRYGIKTRDITLLPIGGLARLERMPEQPIQELWVALAGPAVNVVIAALLFAFLTITNALEPLERLSVTSGSFVERLMAVNISLVLFNLLPAFPMDGGRVVRALLAMRMEYTRATQIAASLGQVMAFVFGFLGLFTNPFLIFIALFVWIGAAQEASMVQMKSALGGIPVSRTMLTDFRTLAPRDPLARVVDLILAGSQHDFPVTENGTLVGILTREKLLAALSQTDRATAVADVMEREFATVDQAEMLEIALAKLDECACQTLAVTQRGQLAGLVTKDNVGEFLMIQAALTKARARSGGLRPAPRAQTG